MIEELDRRAFLSAGAAFAMVRPAGALAAETDLSRLAQKLRGRLILPADTGYDQERRVFWSATADRRPAAIAKCAHEDDIVRCLEFADASGLDVAVRSGGHDAVGASTSDGGLIIDLRPMTGTLFNPERGTARVDGGSKAGEVITALQPTGHVIPFGDSPDVGVGGLSLGGGYGWLTGRFGATCDHILRARVVLADGRRLTASPDSHPDLFWALCGGGGNFGVVTQFEFKTQRVESVISGKIMMPATDVGGFLRLYRDMTAHVPDELQVELGFGVAGGRAILAQFCWSGAPEEAERVLAPLLSYGPPLAISLARRPYSQVDMAPEVDAALRAASPQRRPAGMRVVGGTLPGLTDPVIALLEAHAKQAPPGCAFGITHHLHGAVLRGRVQDSALIRLPGSFCYHLDNIWFDRPAPEQIEWRRAFQQELEPLSAPAYVNYLTSDTPDQVARSYGENFGRLRAIKRRYDPGNRFRSNRNIPPA